MEVTLSVGEGRYYRCWYEPADRRQPLTPRIWPPPVRGEKPEIIRCRTIISARPIYKHVVGRPRMIAPVVTEERNRFLRPAGSSALPPNTYLFAGEITHVDQCRLISRTSREGERPITTHSLTWIVDCELPLHFTVHQRMPFVRSQLAAPGDYVTGLTWLNDNPLGGHGLFQPVRGVVANAVILDLDPTSEEFGSVHVVGFGTKLAVDPDCLPFPTVFLTVDVRETGPVMYEREPARDPECPDLDLPAPAQFPEWAMRKPTIRKLERPIRIGQDPSTVRRLELCPCPL